MVDDDGNASDCVSAMTWWVAYCLAKQELAVAEELTGIEARAFCPHEIVKMRRKKPRREEYTIHEEKVVLFSRYVFIECEEEVLAEVLATRSVIEMVGMSAAGDPIRVSEWAMWAMLDLANSDGVIGARDVSKLSALWGGRCGDHFTFTSGLMDGHRGLILSLDRLDADGTIRAQVKMLGGDVIVDVSHDSVRIDTSGGLTSSV